MQNSKRQKIIMEKIEEFKAYTLSEAITLIQSFPKLKFNESIDVSVNLGVDPKKSDQKCSRIILATTWHWKSI